ncbi:transposase [Paenibacillus durus]|uniref:transposase n=1 Tax=Paenibacillus durus TaxID=44251 RepID=UPI0009E014A3|nr:transposase [Paenibacillus durus]
MDSYRSGADHAASIGLLQVHYSSFSGKATAVPFPVFKALFHLLVRKCSRIARRKLAFPKELLLIDSTTMTVGKTVCLGHRITVNERELNCILPCRLKNLQPLKVIETVGSRHDGPISEDLAHIDYIMVMDWAYGKLERLDRYKEEGQSFVIRLRDNVHLEKPRALRHQKEPESSRCTRFVGKSRSSFAGLSNI